MSKSKVLDVFDRKPKRKRNTTWPSALDIKSDRKRAKLHELRVVPYSLFKEGIQDPKNFLPPKLLDDRAEAAACTSPASESAVELGATSGSVSALAQKTSLPVADQEPTNTKNIMFGIHHELLYRECYDDLFDDINDEILALWDGAEKNGGRIPNRLLFEIRGSAGIGKSAFLALFMASLIQHGNESFALFHVPKSHQNEESFDTLCSIWIDGKLVHEKLKMDKASDILNGIEGSTGLMEKLDYIFMDGCSQTLCLEDFWGIVFVAASPSVSTRQIQSRIMHPHIRKYIMPPWSLREFKQLAAALRIDDGVVEDNWKHMNGIVRYAIIKDAAKTKVTDAIELVDPSSIANLVATNLTNKSTENNMVHSLVLWKTEKVNEKTDMKAKIRFSLVSRFAERLVAEKLAVSETAKLRETLYSLSTVSGAEGYSGALFEAYAVKCIREGGEHLIFRNKEGTGSQYTENLKVSRIADEDVEILEKNSFSKASHPPKLLLKKGATAGKYLSQLIWPRTTNFPTFDAFYLDENGVMYCLQMTVAKKDGKLCHSLNNAGAYQTRDYLEALAAEVAADTEMPGSGKAEKFKAVFVVPAEGCQAKKQSFKGSVQVDKNKTISEKKAAAEMEKAFDQYILYLD